MPQLRTCIQERAQPRGWPLDHRRCATRQLLELARAAAAAHPGGEAARCSHLTGCTVAGRRGCAPLRYSREMRAAATAAGCRPPTHLPPPLPPPRRPLPCHQQRGKTPIVVGGTGLYLRCSILGRPNTPASTPPARPPPRRASSRRSRRRRWRRTVSWRGSQALFYPTHCFISSLRSASASSASLCCCLTPLHFQSSACLLMPLVLFCYTASGTK